MAQCFHRARVWKDSESCDLCRFRKALEKIMPLSMSSGAIDPTSKAGRLVHKASELAFYALFPEWEKKAKEEAAKK